MIIYPVVGCKVHAICRRANVTGDWMLFTDADIVFSRLFATGCTYLISRELDHLTLIPKMTSASIFTVFWIVSRMRYPSGYSTVMSMIPKDLRGLVLEHSFWYVLEHFETTFGVREDGRCR